MTDARPQVNKSEPLSGNGYGDCFKSFTDASRIENISLNLQAFY